MMHRMKDFNKDNRKIQEEETDFKKLLNQETKVDQQSKEKDKASEIMKKLYQSLNTQNEQNGFRTPSYKIF